MDVPAVLDAPAQSVARATSITADRAVSVAADVADMVDQALARVDHTVSLPGRKARRRHGLRGWVTHNRRRLLVAGGLGAIAATAVAVTRHRPPAAAHPSPGSAAMATSGAITPEAAPGSTSEYAPPADSGAQGRPPLTSEQ